MLQNQTLTPALSRPTGEGESLSVRPQSERVCLVKRRDAVLPFPPGEGRGEGNGMPAIANGLKTTMDKRLWNPLNQPVQIFTNAQSL